MLHHPPEYSTGLLADLGHGILFGIWNPKGKICIANVEGFLADALEYCEEMGDRVVKHRYSAEPWDRDMKVEGRLQLSSSKNIAATHWMESVARAYSCVTALQQNSKLSGQGEAEAGDLHALIALIQRSAFVSDLSENP